MTQRRNRKPRPNAELPEGAILERPFVCDGDHGEREMVVPLPPGMRIEFSEPMIKAAIKVPTERDIEEAAIEYVASGLGLDEEKPGAAGIAEHFDEIVAAEVKALDRRGLGFTPAFDMGQSIRDRLSSKVSCFEAAPEARPGPVWAVCPKCEFAFDPKTPERDYRYEVEVVADADAQLVSAIDAFLAAANQPVLFAGLRIWLHAAGRHGQPAVKIAGGQAKKIVELIFRATQP